MIQKEANRLMNDFGEKLDNLVAEMLAETDITPEQINEYYGFANNCQIADMLIEQREFIASL